MPGLVTSWGGPLQVVLETTLNQAMALSVTDDFGLFYKHHLSGTPVAAIDE